MLPSSYSKHHCHHPVRPWSCWMSGVSFCLTGSPPTETSPGSRSMDSDASPSPSHRASRDLPAKVILSGMRRHSTDV